MVAYTCNPSTWQAEGRDLDVQDQPRLSREAISQKGPSSNKNKTNKNANK